MNLGARDGGVACGRLDQHAGPLLLRWLVWVRRSSVPARWRWEIAHLADIDGSAAPVTQRNRVAITTLIPRAFMRLFAFSLTYLLIASSAIAAEQGTADVQPIDAVERVRVDYFIPNFDFRACTLGCFEVRYDRNRVTVFSVNQKGVAKVVGSYVPQWNKADEVPSEGALIREILVPKANRAAKAEGGFNCGADGWGHQFDQLLGAAEVPGGGTVSRTYIGGGQMIVVTVYPNGGGDTTVEPAPIADSAQNSTTCQLMRDQVSPPNE